jgi:hypothetical protein
MSALRQQKRVGRISPPEFTSPKNLTNKQNIQDDVTPKNNTVSGPRVSPEIIKKTLQAPLCRNIYMKSKRKGKVSCSSQFLFYGLCNDVQSTFRIEWQDE